MKFDIEERSRQAVRFMKELFDDKAIIHTRFVHDFKKDEISFNTMVGKSKLKGNIKEWVFKSRNQKNIFPYSNNKKGYAVYVTVNTGGTKEEEITKVNAYFIDADFGKIKHVFPKEETEKINQTILELKENEEIKRVVVKEKERTVAIEGIRTLKTLKRMKKEFLKTFDKLLVGTMIVETRNGFHIYWLVDDGTKEDFVLMEQAIIRLFGDWVDDQVSDLPRILRIPGFLHYKEEDEPFICSVKQWGKRWTKQEIIDTLKLVLQERKEEKKERTGPRGNHKRVPAQTDLKFVKKAYSEKQEMTEGDFVSWIKRQPIMDFFTNKELENKRFHCHFHENDTNESAMLFKLENGVQIYKCFGQCSKKGRDIINMYQGIKGCGYRDALEKLAKIANVTFIETDFQKDQFKKYRDNRRFLEEDVFDSDTFNEKFEFLPKLLSYKRPDYLKMLNDFGELRLSEEEFSISNEVKNRNGEVVGEEKHAIFFISYSEIGRRMKQSNPVQVFNTINLLCLLGFVKKIPNENVPKKLLRRALLEMKKEDEKTINFYIVNNFYDVEEFAEEIAKKLKSKKFTFKYHMNKIGIEKLLGREHAQRIFPDGRVIPERFKGLEASIERYILKVIGEQGYILEENVLKNEFKVVEVDKKTKRKVRKKARKIVVEKTYKRSIQEICKKNDLEVCWLNKEIRSRFEIETEERKKVIKEIDK